MVHRRYIKALEASGWTFIDKPAPSVAFGLNNPPFGMGTDRAVDDQVIGTTSNGTQFQAFRYSSSAVSGRGYVVAMRLPQSLPEFYLMPPDNQRPLIQGMQLAVEPWVVVTSDVGFGERVLDAITPALASMAATYPIDLSIDHDQLVAIGVPRDVPTLKGFVEGLAQVHAAILGLDLLQFSGEEPPEHLSIYRRPNWIYEAQDDSFLEYVDHATGGQNHEAKDIIHSSNFGLPFIALHHTWEVRHTSTDANGHTHTSTEHRDEHIVEFRPPFPFFPFAVNHGRGNRVRFELEAFNKYYDVRCDNPRFAYDILHPRQIEYIMAVQPPGFRLTADGRIEVKTDASGPEVIEFWSDFLRGLFGRVPDFVWRELGAWPRPIAEVEKY